MKLYELLGVKKFYDKHLDDVKKAFTSSGSLYKKLGSGATATAYARGEEYVYKFWLIDTAYEEYVNYCLDNQDNPHIPIFYSDIKNLHSFFARTSDFPNKIRYIKMERLTPINGSTKWPGVKIKNKKYEYYQRIIGIISILYDFSLSKKLLDNFDNFKKNMIIEFVRSFKLVDQAFDENEKESYEISIEDFAWKEMYEIYKIMKDLSEIFNRTGADYHSGNIMMRGKTIVITDPYADDKSMTISDNLAYDMENLARRLKQFKTKKSERDLNFVRGPSPIKKK